MKMKKIYFIIIATLVILPLTSSLAQTSTLLITNGTSVFVPNGAEICADAITIHLGGSLVTENPNGICAGSSVTGDLEEVEPIPTEFALYQNYPNPFNPSTLIKYQVPEKSFVLIRVYDLLGEELATLVNEEKSAGSYEVNFDAGQLSSGFYIYTIKAGNFTSTKKMILMK
jgi:hypothetical protein